MKIIKETYGLNSIDEPLTLYYVFFSEVASVPIEESGIDNCIGAPYTIMKDNMTNIGGEIMSNDSNSMEMERNYKKEGTMTKSPGPNRIDSKSESGLMIESMSSNASTSNASSIEIKTITDRTDFTKVPKLLTLFRLSVKGLSLIMILLATIQYIINQQNTGSIQRNESILIQTVQSQEYFTQLTLLARSYLNINIEIEPSATPSVKNRSLINSEIAFQLLEKLRTNVDLLNAFLVENQNQEVSLSNSMLAYSLLPDYLIQKQNMTIFSLLNLWIISVEEIYMQKGFNSSIGTFLFDIASNDVQQDQTAFFATINPDQGLDALFDNMINQESTMIQSMVSNCVFINLVLTILSSIIACIAVGLGVMVLIKVLSFKSKVMHFFERLQIDQIQLQEYRAHVFQEFLVNCDVVKITDTSQTVIDKMTEMKKGRFNQTLYLPKNTPMISVQGLNKTFVSISDERHFNKNTVQNAIQSQSKNAEILNTKKSNNNKDLNHKGQPISSDEDEKEVDDSKQIRQLNISRKKQSEKQNAEYQTIELKSQQVVKLLNNRNTKNVLRLIPLSVILLLITVTYFVAQYLLFQNLSMQIKSNSSEMFQLVQSIECQGALLSQIREIQSSNNTEYQFSGTDLLATIPGNINVFSDLNATYLQCILINQQASTWLNTIDNGQFSLSGNSSISTCGLYNSIQGSQNSSSISCQQIYNGAMMSAPLEAISLTLQNALYSSIQFLSPSTPRDANSIIANFTRLPLLIDMIDAATFIQHFTLRAYYQQVITWVLANQNTSAAISGLFGAFIGVVVIATTIVHFGVIWRLRKWIWNSYILFQLLPLDDIDIEFIKSINEFIQKA